jgi:hypothetical protein
MKRFRYCSTFDNKETFIDAKSRPATPPGMTYVGYGPVRNAAKERLKELKEIRRRKENAGHHDV